MKREHFQSRLGFLLVSAGCAIGIGNVWKFPYVAGQNGGGVFVLFYLLFLVIMGVPGTQRQQVAHSRLVLRGGLLSADDVLYHCVRLDAGLLLQVRGGDLLRTERRGG